MSSICPTTQVPIFYPQYYRVLSERTQQRMAYEGHRKESAIIGEVVIADEMAWLWRFLSSDEDRGRGGSPLGLPKSLNDTIMP